jgi:hypothetical protein
MSEVLLRAGVMAGWLALFVVILLVLTYRRAGLPLRVRIMTRPETGWVTSLDLPGQIEQALELRLISAAEAVDFAPQELGVGVAAAS